LNVFDGQDMDLSQVRSGKKSIEYVLSVKFSLALITVPLKQ